jgi:hypothetical protein
MAGACPVAAVKDKSMTDEQLLDLARAAATKAYAPYSKFPVGAAIRTEDCLDYTNCTHFDYWKLKLASILPSRPSMACLMADPVTGLFFTVICFSCRLI